MKIFASLLLSFGLTSAPSYADTNRPVYVDCKGLNPAEGYTGLFMMTSYAGSLAVRGFKVDVLKTFELGITATCEGTCVRSYDAKKDRDAAERYHALSCEQKTVTFSASEEEVILNCAPGSEISFSPRTKAYLSPRFEIGRESRFYRGFTDVYITEDAVLIKDPRLGKYNACDRFSNLVPNP